MFAAKDPKTDNNFEKKVILSTWRLNFINLMLFDVKPVTTIKPDTLCT